MRLFRLLVRSALCSTALLLLSCHDPARPSRPGAPIKEDLLCACKPNDVTPEDWRIEVKNVLLPKGAATQEVTVGQILQWPEGDTPEARAPRSGKELTLFHIRKAYLESTFMREGDCDLHIEISEQPDRRAPRMIVETPGRSDYCAARQQFYSELMQAGFKLTNANQRPAHPIPVEVTGLAFRDESHPLWEPRGSSRVRTLWELHPAIVRVLKPTQP